MMEKYLIDKNKNRVLAHAKRLSETEVSKEQIQTLEDGSFAIKIEIEKEPENASIKIVDSIAE
jgi:hypothetical protein